MGLTDVFKNIAEKEDHMLAEVLAAFVNADAFARQQIAGRSAINGKDVLRLGRVMSEYADMAPAETAESYRKQQPSSVRPAAPGPSATAEAA